MNVSIDPFKVRISKPQPQEPLVLSESRLNKLIQNSKSGQDIEADERARLEERKRRQEATKALSKLIMQRKKPGSELRKRQYSKDVKMAQLDIERESRIEARRKYVLDEAYKRLYEETDRVKYFKSAKNMSEMLYQRDKQIEAKTNMADNFGQYDKEFILGMLRDIENYKREEADKAAKVEKDKKKNAENWSKQIRDIQEKKEQEEWQHLRDGFTIREDMANYIEEVKKAELEKSKKKEQYKLMLDEQKNEKLSLLDFYSKLNEAEEKRAEIFNEAKKDMKIKHTEIKKELDKQKELKRLHVANNLKDGSMAQAIKEEAILQKAIRQADAKTKEECALKQAKQEEALKSIQEFYEKEIEEKARKELDEKRRGFQERRKLLELSEEQNKAEDGKRNERRKLEKATQHIQLHQMAKKQMDRNAEKLEGIKDCLNHIRSLNDEEEVFQKYAGIEINECESRGLDTRPMHFAARPGIECGRGPLYEHRGNIRPRYYSSVSQGDELNHIQRVKKEPDTKQRLGFMLH